MAEKTEFLQAIDDAILDADSLERFINGDETQDVLTRLNAEYPTLRKALKELFESGGLPATPFKTKALMETDGVSLPDGQYAMVTDDTANNGLYIKESGTWVKSNYDLLSTAVRSAYNIVNSQMIDVNNTIVKSINLVDPSKATSGVTISADGTIVEASMYRTSDFIPVEPDAEYTMYRNAETTSAARAYSIIAYYDASKKFISRLASIPQDTGIGPIYTKLTMPSNVYYIRLSTNGADIDHYDRMFYKGDEQKPYQPYSKPVLTGVTLGGDISEQVVNLSPISPYLVKSKNLFDYNDTQEGFVISTDGSVNTAFDYTISGFIEVEPNGIYTMQSVKDGTDAFIHTAFYDENKQFIKRSNTRTRDSEDGSLTITIPDDAYFVRFNIHRGSASSKDRMFHKGSGLVDYEEFGVTLTGLNIDGIDSENNSYQYDMQIPSLYQTDKVWSGYRESHYRQPNGNVYAKFDALQQAHPDYITKQVLGDDDWGNTISCYHFKPSRLPIPTASKFKNPKVFIICGTHGHEHMPPLATYLMMKELAESWDSDPALELLRHNVDFLIIPVANPSGWDDYTRKNRNGVDINRSFPPGFGWQSTDPESLYYGGEEPLQEKESQYINQVLLENKDIDICLDFHNFHGESGRAYYIWFATDIPEMERVGQLLSNKMTRVWRKDFEWLPDNYDWNVGRVTSSGGAQVQAQAAALGVPLTATFEICQRWWLNPNAVTYDEIHCKTGVETLVNALLLMLDKLKSHSN